MSTTLRDALAYINDLACFATEEDPTQAAAALLAIGEKARAALAQSDAQPAGWKLVPIEPTEAMIDATYHGQPLADIWHDMLAASPQEAPALERLSFRDMCELMPADFNWQDPCTPQLVQHIAAAIQKRIVRGEGAV